jgi:hypothetical protein
MSKNLIILRSVFGKVGQSYVINPCIDPSTGRYPNHVKMVDSNGDMILSEKDKSSDAIFIAISEPIEITDGTIFDLNEPVQKAKWEAIKNSAFIAPEREAHSKDGSSLIDGNRLKYGSAHLYIERPGEDTKVKNTKRKLITEAHNYIFKDSKENQITKCKLLGKNMSNAYPSDIEDFLLNYADKFPQKIIDLYTGTDVTLRMLLIDALQKGVIVQKNSLYLYGDKIAMGVTDDSVIIWMKQQENAKFVELIKKETYPEMYEIKK